MINAAEPVDSTAIINFYEYFRPYNLPNGVVIPTYGLAEHTGDEYLDYNVSSTHNNTVTVVE
jgi:hypothetical protein